METPAECESEVGSPQSNVPAIMEAAEGQEVAPSSPPPSYEYVLEEASTGFCLRLSARCPESKICEKCA